MDMKICIVHIYAWTIIFTTASLQPENLKKVKSQQIVMFQPDTCYKISLYDLCSHVRDEENSEREVVTLEYDTLVPCNGNETSSNGDGYWMDHDQRVTNNMSSRSECTAINTAEYLWTANTCTSVRPNDEIRKRCQASFPDFLTQLPVVGKSGLTYKNAFCAYCNNDSHFELWPLYAECQWSIPEEVLAGDIRVIVDYAMEFCDLRLASTLDIIYVANRVFKEYGQTSSLGKFLGVFPSKVRRCLRDLDSASLHLEDIFSFVRQEVASVIGCNRGRDLGTNSISIGISSDSILYWNLPANMNLRYAVTKNQSTKQRKLRWIPPSFSLLFQLHEPNDKVIYTEKESGSTTVLSATNTCGVGEVYDPLYRACRPVLCTSNQAFKGVSCVENTEAIPKESSGRSAESVTRTVTVVVEVPSSYFPTHFNESNDVYIIGQSISEAVSTNPHMSKAILDDVTVTNFPVKYPNYNKNGNDDRTVFSVSFVLMDSQQLALTDEEIIQVANNVSSWISFERLLLETDYLSILLVDSYQLLHMLPNRCEEGDSQLMYFDDEYEVVEYEGQLWVHVLDTYQSYKEPDYQFLDWIITVSENGTERTFIDNSRVLVCEKEAANVSSCHIFIPLNETEYVVSSNGDVYLINRNTTVPKNDSVVVDGKVAICVDDYMSIESNGSNGQDNINEEIRYILWVEIAIWINFCLAVLSLISLLITFITYMVFEDLRTISGCCMMNLIVAEFSSTAIFLFAAGAEISENPCIAIAVLLHALFLSAFFWNNVISFDVWRTFGHGLKTAVHRMARNRSSAVGFQAASGKKIIYRYMAYAWGSPCLIIIISVSLDFWADVIDMYEYDPSVRICWISNPVSYIVSFGLPVFLILFVNAIFFCLTIRAIRKFKERSFGDSNTFRGKVPSVSEEIESMEFPDSPKFGDNNGVDVMSQEGQNVSCKYKSARQASIKCRTRLNLTLSSSRSSSKRATANVYTYLKMSILMGFSWLIGYVAAFANVLILWLVFELSISLHGIFILLAFVWKKRIRERYRNLFSSSFCTKASSRSS